MKPGPGITTCPAVWLLPPGPSSRDHPSQINRGMIFSFKPDRFCVAADLIAALVSFELSFAAFDRVSSTLQRFLDEACRLLNS